MIYCVEGVHDWGDGEQRTVEPMLELLRRLDCWEYRHTTCATRSELEYRLREEWNRCPKGSVLYFNTHGAADQIWLREDDQAVSVLTLKEWVDCDGCHVHFGGCDTFSDGKANLKKFMDYTGAVSVSGYATQAGWVGPVAPGLTLELQFFGLLTGVNFRRKSRDRTAKLRKIEKDVQGRFPDCAFRMLVSRYKKS